MFNAVQNRDLSVFTSLNVVSSMIGSQKVSSRPSHEIWNHSILMIVTFHVIFRYLRVTTTMAKLRTIETGEKLPFE